MARPGRGPALGAVVVGDIVWAVFVGVNLLGMHEMGAWSTIPFLVIWVSLTLVYGLRMWRLQPAILTVAVVTLATGGIIVGQVVDGQQEADYLVEVPLVALMFLAMVWHGRRRQAALLERLAAMEEVQRVSRENLRLLEQQQLFLVDASHELGTPITVALGHAELIEQSVTDKTGRRGRPGGHRRAGETAQAVEPHAAACLGRQPRLP